MKNQEFKTQTVDFRGTTCVVNRYKYQNGQNCLKLVDLEDWSPYCTASVAYDVEIGEDEVIIKDYSENSGVMKALVEAKVIEPSHRIIETPFVYLYVCKLTKNC